jgi:ABC-type transport system involved in multi-copper enzyme maturation permease subunit
MLGQTFWTNIASVGLSTAVMITIVYIIFKRKDIKNQ